MKFAARKQIFSKLCASKYFIDIVDTIAYNII